MGKNKARWQEESDPEAGLDKVVGKEENTQQRPEGGKGVGPADIRWKYIQQEGSSQHNDLEMGKSEGHEGQWIKWVGANEESGVGVRSEAMG